MASKVQPLLFPIFTKSGKKGENFMVGAAGELVHLGTGAESGGCSCGSKGAADLALALAAHWNRMGR